MKELHIFQKGFNYSQDGPGNRLVYHLSGCSLRCPWCANPEGKPHSGGEVVSLSSILQEAISCKPMFFENGGVTFTGGEATEQFDALKELLQQLKAESISTCIETNCTHPRLPELFSLIDYLIVDCKHYDDSKHQKIIGCSNRTILQNIALACTQRNQLAIRIPLIGGFNTTVEDARGFSETFRNIGATQIATVELLRYHEYGKDKYTALGLPYTMTQEAHITDEVYQQFANALTQSGVRLISS